MGKEVIHNPVTGETLLVIESNAEVFKFAIHLRSGGATTAEHIHPTQRQVIKVLSGELHCQIGRKQRVVRAGESVLIEPGVVHHQWNPTNQEVFAIKEVRPGSRFQLMFRVAFALAWDGRTNSQGFLDPLIGAAFLKEFKDVVRPARLRHRLLFSLLAPISRQQGYGQIIQNYISEFQSGPARGHLNLTQLEDNLYAGIRNAAIYIGGNK